MGVMAEGMESESGSGGTSSSFTSGVGGGSNQHATTIKEQVVNLQDRLLLGKYKDTYEEIIVSTDDLLNGLMLKTILELNPKTPHTTIKMLAEMNQAKSALNSVMKTLD
jgi:hypothetical protein